MTEPSHTPEHDAAEEQVHTPAPTPDTESKEPKKDTKSKKKDFPVGQVAAGGLGAVTLGSYALASVVGPIGWAAAPAAATVAGAGYVAYRRRKSRSGMERTKTTITRTRGSRSMRGGGLPGLRSRGGGGRSGLGSAGRAGGVSTSAKRSGGLGSSGRSGAGLGSSSARKSGLGVGSRGGAAVRRTGGGATPRTGSSGRRTPGGGGGGGLFGRGGSSPRSGGSGGGLLGRGATPRSAKGGTTPRGGSSSRRSGGGLLGRGSDATASKRKSTPPGGSPRTSGGSMPKSRWGGASGPTSRSTRGGRIRRSAARARDWADDKTGRRMSTGWRAARKEKGFKARRRAAGQAVRAAGGGGVIAGAVGVIAAAFAGLANLFGWSSKDKKKTSAATEPTSAISSHPVYTWLADGTPFIYLIPKDLLASTDPLRFKSDTRSSPTSTSTATPTGGTTMSGLPAAQIAHDMSAAMSRYEPADAYQIVPDSRQWVDVPHQVAMAVKAYADRLEGARFPINDAINDKLREFAQAMAATRSIAEEIEPLMRKAHADDLARKEAPRGDESKWNI